MRALARFCVAENSRRRRAAALQGGLRPQPTKLLSARQAVPLRRQRFPLRNVEGVTGSTWFTAASPSSGNVPLIVGGAYLYAFGPTGSDAPALPERPDPQTLSPDLSLPLSRPSARLPATDE